MSTCSRVTMIAARLALIAAMGACLALAAAGCGSEAKRLVREGDNLRSNDDAESLAKALEKYQQAIQVDPQYAKAYEKIASVAKKKGDYTTALEYYRKAFDIDPDQVSLYRKIAGAHVHRYEDKKDPEDLRKGLEIAEQALKDRLVLRDPDLSEGVKEDVRTIKELLALHGQTPADAAPAPAEAAAATTAPVSLAPSAAPETK